MDNDHGQLLRDAEAAELIACSRTNVYELIAAGQLCRHFIGRDGKSKTRVCEPSVRAFINRTATPVTAA